MSKNPTKFKFIINNKNNNNNNNNIRVMSNLQQRQIQFNEKKEFIQQIPYRPDLNINNIQMIL